MRKFAAVVAAPLDVGLAPTLSNPNHCAAREYITMWPDIPPDSVFQSLWWYGLSSASCPAGQEGPDTQLLNPGATVLQVLVNKPAVNMERAKPTNGTVTFNTSPATTRNLVFTFDASGCNCWISQSVTIPSSA